MTKGARTGSTMGTGGLVTWGLLLFFMTIVGSNALLPPQLCSPPSRYSATVTSAAWDNGDSGSFLYIWERMASGPARDCYGK